MSFGANVVQRKDFQPIYILIAEDQTVKEGVQYYRLNSLPNESNSFVDISGFLLTKTEAGKLNSNPYSDVYSNETKLDKLVNRKIPCSKVIRIDNINYKKEKPQGE